MPSGSPKNRRAGADKNMSVWEMHPAFWFFGKKGRWGTFRRSWLRWTKPPVGAPEPFWPRLRGPLPRAGGGGVGGAGEGRHGEMKLVEVHELEPFLQLETSFMMDRNSPLDSRLVKGL